MPITVPLHWTQTPAGRKKLKQTQKKRWANYNAKKLEEQQKETAKVVSNGAAKFRTMAEQHIKKAQTLTELENLMDKLEGIVIGND